MVRSEKMAVSYARVHIREMPFLAECIILDKQKLNVCDLQGKSAKDSPFRVVNVTTH